MEAISNPKNKFWAIVTKIVLIGLNMVINNQKGIKGTDNTIIVNEVINTAKNALDK